MATVNMSEDDFGALAWAATEAARKGDMKAAEELDKIARKVDAALSNAKYSSVRWVSGSAKRLTWRDVPSTLSTMNGR